MSFNLLSINEYDRDQQKKEAVFIDIKKEKRIHQDR